MGLDATSVFEDVGHSAMAQTIMLQYVIGRLVLPKKSMPISLCRSIHTNTSPATVNTTSRRRLSSATTTASSVTNIITTVDDTTLKKV